MAVALFWPFNSATLDGYTFLFMRYALLNFPFVDSIWSHFPQMLSAPVHQLWSSLPHNLVVCKIYIFHVAIIPLALCFYPCRLEFFINNYQFHTQNRRYPLQPCSVCRVITILHYAAVVFLRWPKWLCEMHACDQSAVACWSSLFLDTVHSPQAPATDNGSLCQTAWGRLSSRMLGVLCWMAAIKWCSLRRRVQTKIWKGIRYAECVMQTSLLITYRSKSESKNPLLWGIFFFCAAVCTQHCAVLKLLLN